MIIYGVALLAGCYMAGNLIGDVLGMALGVNANIGGVGFAMLLLIVISTWAEQKGIMKGPEEAGIKFWASMYIPIVVAMSSIQNVVAALSGGMVAILGGALAVVLGFLLIPVLSPHHSSEQKMAGKVALNEGKQYGKNEVKGYGYLSNGSQAVYQKWNGSVFHGAGVNHFYCL